MLSSALAGLFAESKLTPELGRPLYAYRCSDERFAALEVALKGRLRASQPLDAEEGAALCIYVAEHLCRFYDGGPRRWKEPLDRVGAQYGPWLYAAVSKGLRFLGRRLLPLGEVQGHLLTLACEGGLPLALIRSARGSLYAFLADTLREREAYPTLDAREIVSRHLTALAPSLANPVIADLAFQLTSAVLDLRALLRTRTTQDPIAALDQLSPEWRHEVPLRLDDDTAVLFLRALMSARFSPPERAAGLSLRTLFAVGSGRVLKRCARPARVRADVLRAQLGLAEDTPLPDRLELWLGPAEEPRHALGFGWRRGDTFELELEGAGVISSAALLVRDLYLHAASSGRPVGSARREPLPGGAALTSLPWLFEYEPAAPELRFLGQGAKRLACEEALMLVRADDTPRPLQGGVVTKFGVLESIGRTAWRVSGHVELDADEGRLGVHTRVPVEQHETELVLMGSRGPIAPGGTEVWFGPPVLRELSDTTSKPRSYEWRSRSPGSAWTRDPQACLGEVQLRYSDGEGLRLLRDLHVVPATTSCETRADRTLVRIRGLPLARAHLEQVEGTVAEAQVEAGVHVFRVVTTAESFRCRFDHGAGRSGTLRLPAPSPRKSFIDPNGRELGPNELISLDDLDGLTAQALSTTAGRKFIVSGGWSGGRAAELGALVPQDHGWHRLPLSTLRPELDRQLSTRASLDAELTLTLSALPENTGVSLRVRRYSAWLVPKGKDHEGAVLQLDGRLPPDLQGGEPLRAEARPLVRPDAPAVVLSELGVGRWRFSASAHPRGPHLVTLWRGYAAVARPMRMTVRVGPELPLETHQERASALPDAKREAEHGRLLDALLGASAAEWALIEAQLQACQSLPSNTFELLPRLAVHCDAAAMLILRRGDDDATWRVLERLPFAPWLIPLESWARAAGRHAAIRAEEVAELRRVLPDFEASPPWYLDPSPARWERRGWLQAIIEVVSRSLPGIPPLRSELPDEPHALAALRGPLLSRILSDLALGDEARLREPSEVAMLDRRLVERLLIAETSIARAPVLAALLCTEVGAKSLSQTAIEWSRRAREVAPAWFDPCYGMTVTLRYLERRGACVR